jgi:hypothetical protein
MSTNPEGEPRALPSRPNLRHLKDQARDLVRTGAATSLAAALFTVARAYGFTSWSKLKTHVTLRSAERALADAIDRDERARVISLLTAAPELHHAPIAAAAPER